MPAKSCGFCVAITKNGSGKGMLCPSRETWPSFIASSRADCVRGLARLISSARRTLVKMGPGRRTNSLVRLSNTETPRTSLGSRSLVNCSRRKISAHRLGEGAGQGGLAYPRHILDEQVPTPEEGDESELYRLLLALKGAFDGTPQMMNERRVIGGHGGRSGHAGERSTVGAAARPVSLNARPRATADETMVEAA